MLRILRPRVRRPLEINLCNAFETCFFEHRLKVAGVEVRTTKFFRCLLKKLSIAVERVGGLEGSVVGCYEDIDLLDFYVAARFEVTVKG